MVSLPGLLGAFISAARLPWLKLGPHKPDRPAQAGISELSRHLGTALLYLWPTRPGVEGSWNANVGKHPNAAMLQYCASFHTLQCCNAAMLPNLSNGNKVFYCESNIRDYFTYANDITLLAIPSITLPLAWILSPPPISQSPTHTHL